MRKRMFSDSDVAQMLNDVDRLIDAGSSATAACRQIGISQQSYYAGARSNRCGTLSRARGSLVRTSAWLSAA